ncbi:MAG: hypothetical protein AAGJ35_07455 [Myxococcota bacterium]
MAFSTRRFQPKHVIAPKNIPRQHCPAPLRLLLKLCVFPFMMLDLTIQRLIQRLFPPPYKVEGGCLKRGMCCHYILMGWSPWGERLPWVGKFWLWWYTDVHGFYERGFEVEDDAGHSAKVMRCRYLRKDGLCGQYRLRPALCRQWPRIEYGTRPQLLKGCGYKILNRSAGESIETTQSSSTQERAPEERVTQPPK